ncbi:TPA: phage holin family protein [Salmonella enterica subsp. enterica serovar Ball]|uniref:Holin n=1 Tax=Salmonella enterica subsp. salamae TaxID=59202 RepID=A0A5Y2S6X9_SALER|nr:holin [Salmonella enterica subsp. salamae]EGS6537723.1 holin [Salmonella enterica]HCA3435109.1 phage holin family protein [Salmonella enterica subsp. enterica serovar Ball]ECF6053864.1 holin [Salmonella enterica subsp. salamae]ECG1232758.1 holin [Salmonella enterica subsp. salamae]
MFMLPKPLPDAGTTFSWLLVGCFSAWGGIVRYLMENKASGKNFSWHEVLRQVVISGFTGFLAGIYSYEHGYSNLMTMVYSGLGGALGGYLLDLLWKRFTDSLEK